MDEHKTEIAYWAGRLIGYDQSWEVAEEIVAAIKEAQNTALILPAVIWQSEQLVCPSCGSQIIVSDERHNIKMCGVCKEQWAN